MEKYKDIQYTIKYTSRKDSIALSFIDNLTVEIRAPKRVRNKTILKFLEKNYDFIKDRLSETEEVPRNYLQGEIFYISGEKYKLNIILSDKNNIEVTNGKINLYIAEDSKELKKDLIVRYYKKLVKIDVDRLTKKWSKKMNVSFNSISINTARTRWGSCNFHRKTLNFSIRVAMLPEDAQEYIVVHELAHLIEPNHSYKYWQVVAKYFPAYKEIEQSMKSKRYII